MNYTENDVILAILKLSRAMRRCPPERKEFPFPPAVGRLLGRVAGNADISSRELCEMMDLRPSSLSEMLARAEAEGLITRRADEEDRRVVRVTLSPKGQDLVDEMDRARTEDARKKAACLTEEERELFCVLCEKLSGHIESLALDLPEGMRPLRRGPGCPPHPTIPGEDRPDGPGPHCPPPLPPEGRYRC